MKALFYTSIIVAGAMLLFVALFPRGKFAPMPAVPATRGDGMRPEAAMAAHSPAVP